MNAVQSKTSADEMLILDLGQQAYQPVWELQKQLQQLRIEQQISDTIVLVEHRPVYTIGKSGNALNIVASEHFLKNKGIEVIQVDRGGDVTYHGPGQLVGYPIFDLRQHQKSISWYMRQLEAVFIEALKYWEIQGSRNKEYTGVWVGDEKIVAMGVRISRWVTMHGFALNVNTELTDFNGIIPCGISERGVTSLQRLCNGAVEMALVKEVVLKSFQHHFNFEALKNIDSEKKDLSKDNGKYADGHDIWRKIKPYLTSSEITKI